MPEEQYLSLDQLCVGLYIYLDLKWMEHPFAFSHFRIKSDDQIKTIRGLGLTRVRYSPELSEGVQPLPASGAPVPKEVPVALEQSPEMIAKRALREQNLQRQAAAQMVEKAFVSTAQAIRGIEKTLYSKPAESVQQATKLITQITDSILSVPEIALHVMGDKMGGEELYFHSLNVTMLSMIVARDLKLPVEVAGVLGMGALMHDIGHKDVPDKIRLKSGPLNPAERNFYEMHCEYGVKTGQHLHLAPAALAIIREHHELYDGTGYPAKRKGEAIGLLSRIVVIANYYDELCNPPQIEDALTPYEALSLMFSKLSGKFDPKLLQIFIRCLGVYPPGTIVKLSNGALGMVATVNTARPMKPTVAVYEAGVPKEEAMLLDLEQESELSIVAAIRPAQVPLEVYNQLSPRKRVSYYAAAAPAKAGGAKR